MYGLSLLQTFVFLIYLSQKPNTYHLLRAEKSVEDQGLNILETLVLLDLKTYAGFSSIGNTSLNNFTNTENQNP